MRVLLLTVCCASLLEAQSRLPQFELHVDRRIGAADGELAFGSIGDVAVDAAGNLYVTDGLGSVVHVIDTKNRLVRTIGRRGDGPGDLNGPKYIGWLGDSLWVSEFRGRTSLFTGDGKFVRRIYDGGRHSFDLQIPAVNARGVAVLLSGLGAGGPNRDDPALILGVADRTSRVDTLLLIPRPHSALKIYDKGHLVMGANQPFSDDPVGAVSPDGEHAAIVDFHPVGSDGRGRYRVRVFSISKRRLVQSRTFEYEAQRFTEKHLERALESWQGREVGPYFPKDRDAALRRAIYQPKWLRPIAAVSFGNDGSIWLRRRRDSDEAWTFVMLDRDLRPAGELRVDDMHPIRFGRSGLWLVSHDELDVPVLIHARLTRKRH